MSACIARFRPASIYAATLAAGGVSRKGGNLRFFAEIRARIRRYSGLRVLDRAMGPNTLSALPEPARRLCGVVDGVGP